MPELRELLAPGTSSRGRADVSVQVVFIVSPWAQLYRDFCAQAVRNVGLRAAAARSSLYLHEQGTVNSGLGVMGLVEVSEKQKGVLIGLLHVCVTVASIFPPRPGKSHGAVLWMEYQLTSDSMVSTGLMNPAEDKVVPWA